MLLQEEMRRCLVTLEWQAKRWDQLADVHTFEGERLEGAKSYAHEQAAIRRVIANRFTTLWNAPEISGFYNFNPPDLDLNSLFGQAVLGARGRHCPALF